MDQRKDQRMDGPTDKVSYKGAMLTPKNYYHHIQKMIFAGEAFLGAS
jgi:hypothetical protein